MKVQRNTYPKKIILETLRTLSTHPTVEEVYIEVQKTHPTISKNTVYRNLRRLAENGEIRKVSLPGEQERYDRLADRHYHYECESCGGISDVLIDYLEGADEAVRQKYELNVSGHELVFKGVCSKCGGIR